MLDPTNKKIAVYKPICYHLGSQMLELGSITVEGPAVLDAEHEPRSKERSLSTAEFAECTCPEFCERDHDTD